jgi:hypothetical protein
VVELVEQLDLGFGALVTSLMVMSQSLGRELLDPKRDYQTGRISIPSKILA